MTDPGSLAKGLADNAEAFCRHWFPSGRKTGNYWQMGDTTGAAGQSLSIRLRSTGNQQAGKWTDYATGEYGDLLDLLQEHLQPISYKDLLEEASKFLGNPISDPIKSSQDNYKPPNINNNSEAGRKLFSYGQPWKNTPTERYLRNRSIARFGSALAYHPSVFLRDDHGVQQKYPALLAAITDNENRVTGCARTFLNIEKNIVSDMEAPKRVLGQLHGNAIRFPFPDLKKDMSKDPEDLIVGEGLENILSVGTAFPMFDLASCLTANHLGLFIPPPGLKRMWIARDNDEAGEAAASTLRQRVQGSGIEVFDLVPDGDDFNLDLQNDGLSVMRKRLAAIMLEYVPDLQTGLS